ncbi:MAG: hypothetical protein JNM67_08910 [Bacteroidetes bacterium]|nr:hypothetical protein [Bacteroidota bacterium]
MSKDTAKSTRKKVSQAELKEEISKIAEESVNPQEFESKKGSTKRKKSSENDPKIVKVERFINERYELKLDVISNTIMVREKNSNEDFQPNPKFENTIIVELMRAGFSSVNSCVSALLGSSLFVREYNPIKSYFESLPKWDGVDRITMMANCVDTYSFERDLFNTHFRKHLLRCIATIFIPKFFNKHCLVIIGVGQSQGKSSFIRHLVPECLHSYMTESIMNWADKDSEIAIGSNWIINLEELDNLEREDTNRLKSVLSRNSIKIRRPYERVATEMPRLANFFASTNNTKFLTDLTGNVRWICFRISSIDWSYSDLDINQLWAQALELFKKGADCQLTKEEREENDRRNEAFMLSNPERDAVVKFLMPGIKNIKFNNEEPQFGTSTDLMKLVNERGGYNFKSVAKFGKVLQSCGFTDTSEWVASKKMAIYGYWYHVVETEIISNDKISVKIPF